MAIIYDFLTAEVVGVCESKKKCATFIANLNHILMNYKLFSHYSSIIFPNAYLEKKARVGLELASPTSIVTHITTPPPDHLTLKTKILHIKP